MNPTTERLWEKILEKAVSITQNQKDEGLEDIVVYMDAKILFEKNFEYYYGFIKDKFMANNIELDRHKKAAIIICSILSAEILGISQQTKAKLKDKNDPRKAFLANEKLAVDIALSYMHEALKQEIREGKVQIGESLQSGNYRFPTSLSCPEKNYSEILCRELYFSKTFFQVCPMSIANTLFLLEMYSYPTLKSNSSVEHKLEGQ